LPGRGPFLGFLHSHKESDGAKGPWNQVR
jgi:hypothetical protein